MFGQTRVLFFGQTRESIHRADTGAIFRADTGVCPYACSQGYSSPLVLRVDTGAVLRADMGTILRADTGVCPYTCSQGYSDPTPLGRGRGWVIPLGEGLGVGYSPWGGVGGGLFPSLREGRGGLPLQYERLGELQPLVVHDDAEGAAFELAQLVGAVGQEGEAGGEVLAAVVVDDLELCLSGRGQLGGRDEPLARVALCPHVARQFAEELGIGHGDGLSVEVDVEPHLVFGILDGAAERSRVVGLCDGLYVGLGTHGEWCEHGNDVGDEQSFHGRKGS